MDTTTETPIEREAAHCRTCGKPFQSAVCRNPLNPSNVLARQLHCDPCVAAEQERIAKTTAARRAEAAERDLQAAWERICPHEYRTKLEGGPTDLERLGRDLPQLPEILAHPLGPQGLILRGKTGAGKTRAMYRLLRSYFVRTPRPRIIAITAGEFDRQARDAAGNFTLSTWFRRLAEAEALFLDDLGKGKWTAATSGQFWELVDDRTRNGRPVFITTNFSGDRLVQVLGLDGDTAEPLLRRLREHCRGIVCTSETRSTKTP